MSTKKAVDLSVFDKQLRVSNPSTVCRLKLLLTPEQIEAVDAAFESGLYPKAAIIRVIKDEWGQVISDTPLLRHRDKGCSCYV